MDVTIFTTISCEECPYGIQCWDSNPRPSNCESHPITRPLTLTSENGFNGQLGSPLIVCNIR